MITVITEECNEFSQVFYDASINFIQRAQLPCSCGHSGCLIGHGSYTRSVKTAMGKALLVIQRVKCSICGATHALIPSGIVPYSQVPLKDHAAIAASYEHGGDGLDAMDQNPELSPSQVFYILSQYLCFWRQRLLSEGLPLTPLCALAQGCVRSFGRQFMQIKRTRNLLFRPPT